MHRLTCREFIDFLDDYCAGKHPPQQQQAFERHLAMCADCRNYLHSYRQTIHLSRNAMAGKTDMDMSAVPSELIHAVLTSLRGNSNTRLPPNHNRKHLHG